MVHKADRDNHLNEIKRLRDLLDSLRSEYMQKVRVCTVQSDEKHNFLHIHHKSQCTYTNVYEGLWKVQFFYLRKSFRACTFCMLVLYMCI